MADLRSVRGALFTTLRDGSTIEIRRVLPRHLDALKRFYEGLSRASITLRFFSPISVFDRFLEKVTVSQPEQSFGLIARTGEEHTVVAHAMYMVTGPGRAEVALAVADHLQGLGIGTVLLGQLAEVAGSAGIHTFEAVVLPENHRMIDAFKGSGFPLSMRSAPGEIHVELGIEMGEETLEHFERREKVAAAAAVARILRPGSVALVGASRHRGTVGGDLFHNMLSSGFTGIVYPVNAQAASVQGVKAYPSVAAIPDPVDLVVVAVRSDQVLEVARQAAGKGVKGLLVISAGFAETGPEGLARQQDLLALCRHNGIRLLGPNCMGALNTSPEVGMNATFAPQRPLAGRVGFMSQSGGLGLAALEQATALGIGFSGFVSVGNKADLSGNDFIQFWESDPETDVILLYLESFGNPRKFARIARRVTRSKPIVAVKSGRSSAGARATSSHTGAVISGSDRPITALFQQAGVIRCDTMQELFETANLLASQPVPAGTRVGIVTNAGGPGILAADAAAAAGLDVVQLTPEVRERLSQFLAEHAATANPVDLLAEALPEQYAEAITILAGSGEVDALIVIYLLPLRRDSSQVMQAINGAVAKVEGRLPVLMVHMSRRPDEPPATALTGLPTWSYPEDAARALAHAAAYGKWRATPQGTVVRHPDIDHTRAAAVVARALEAGSEWLGPGECLELLGCYGIRTLETRLAATAREAAERATEIGGRVALKAFGSGLLHRTEVGAVALDLEPGEVPAAAAAITGRLAATGLRAEGFQVQPMVASGVELLIGMAVDSNLGPVLACGLGGTSVELLKDLSLRITPLTDRDASEMLRSLRTFPLLDGYRGAPKADVGAVEDMLLRLSELVEARPEVAEIDLNPVIAHPEGAVAVDFRIRLRRPPPNPLLAE